MYEFNDQKPLFKQLKDKLEEAILDGSIQPNEVFPSIRKLAKNYSLNALTVANAVDELHRDGIIYKKRGVGMYVSEDAKTRIIRKYKDNFIDIDITSVITKGKLLGVHKHELLQLIDFIYE